MNCNRFPAKREWSTAEKRDFFNRCCPGLKWHGDKGVGRCPLPGHHDAKPSFGVDAVKGVWFCHSEARGGGLLALSKELGVELPDRRR